MVGFLESGLGLGETARLFEKVLEVGEIPHCSVAYSKIESDNIGHQSGNASTAPIYDTNFFCLNGDQMRPFAQEAGVDFFDGRYNIGLWFWETEVLPPEMVVGLDFLDEVWVCSDFVHKAVSAAVDIPVRFLPHPTRTAPQVDPARIDWLGLGDRFVFMFAFDFLSDLRRKNPMALIDAFAQAFPEAGGDTGPVLVIKTINGEKRPVDLLYLRNFARRHESIQLVDQFLAREEKDALMARADCYVSLHRSEGLGQTLLEAMALGIPCLATGYSGNLQFMDSSNSFLCQHGMSPIGKSSYPYPEGEMWGDPDIDDAVVLMREIHGDPEAAKARGERGRKTVETEFSLEVAAGVFKKHLDEIGDRATRVDPAKLPVATRKAAAHEFIRRELRDGKLDGFRPGGAFKLDYPQVVKLLSRYDRYQRKTQSSILKALKESEQKQRKEIRRLEGVVSRLTELMYALVAELEEDSGADS